MTYPGEVCRVAYATRGVCKMKAMKNRVQGADSVGNQQVREEIENFLRALSSYPESFLRHPGISFEQHRDLIASAQAQAEKPASRRAAANSG